MKLFLLGLVFVMNGFASVIPQQGTLEIVTYDDFKNQRSYQEMYLVTKDNRRLLVVPHRRHGLKDSDGQLLQDNQIVKFISTKRKSILARELTIHETPKVADINGIRSSLLIIGDFQDLKVPCSASEIEDGLFGAKHSVDQLYREMSAGTTGLTNDASLTVTIDARSGDQCDVRKWSDLANAAALAAGVDPDKYQQLMYVFPKSTCTFAGLASANRAVNVDSCKDADILAHEIGHILGLKHAGTPMNTYGDTSDIMGFAGIGLRGLNGPHLLQMNWIEPSQVVTLSGVNNTVTIAALNQSAGHAGAPQIYKILKNDGTFLYLTYRQPLGYDQGAGANSFQGVNIHSWLGNSYSTVRHAQLKDGETFYDLKNGVTIYQRNHLASGVNVETSVAGTTTNGTPVNFRASLARSKKRVKADLSWQAPISGAVKDYLIIKDGVVISKTASLSYTDQAITLNNTYTYSVVSRNAEGKFSPESNSVSLKVTK